MVKLVRGGDLLCEAARALCPLGGVARVLIIHACGRALGARAALDRPVLVLRRDPMAAVGRGRCRASGAPRCKLVAGSGSELSCAEFGAAKPQSIKLEKKAAPVAKSAPSKPVQKTGDFSVNPTKPGKKTYTKKGAESSDLSDAALAEKLQSKF